MLYKQWLFFCKEKLKKNFLYSKIFSIGGKMKISEFISEKVVSRMWSEIKRYGGNEIFLGEFLIRMELFLKLRLLLEEMLALLLRC